MKCRTIQETKSEMAKTGKNWRIPFMEFMDDLRSTRDGDLIENPFSIGDEKFEALLASTTEYLCDELELETPAWVWEIPSCKEP